MTQASPDSPEDRRLAAIVESSDDAIIAKDLNGIAVAWNKAAERLLGYSAAEAIGRHITVIFPPDRVAEEQMFLARILAGHRVDHYETTRRRRDGGLVSVSVSISPILDRHGRVVGASKILRDLTERNAQTQSIAQLQAELAHVQRLNELGQMVASLVHEVNQPLTAISNYAAAGRRLVAPQGQERLLEALDHIAGQTRRTRDIVQRIASFVRRRNVEMQAEELAPVIDEAVNLTRTFAGGAGLVTSVDVPPAGMQVLIDRIQVQQVLFNLMRNGIEAMDGQAAREVRISARPATGGMVEIGVADHGTGLADEVRDRLFQPFVTTKATGMGVGLSVCRSIVEAHAGRLWAEDNPGGGTVFRFTMRRAGAMDSGAAA